MNRDRFNHLAAQMEPRAAAHCSRLGPLAAASSAISLRRIADALERLDSTVANINIPGGG